jgi:transcriptional regulator with XRE-family HTH domain
MTGNVQQGRSLTTPGAALKELRTQRAWTLGQISDRTGIPVSTLSKFENGKAELTTDRLLSISVALGVNIADLFGTPSYEYQGAGRRSITRSGEGNVVKSTYGDYCYHAQDLLEKLVSPIIAEIRAKSVEEFGEFHRHRGEEYVLVLEGELALYSDTYSVVHLKKGESIYFDSGMGHAYVAAGKGPCRILLICAGTDVLRMIEGRREVTEPKP